MTDRAWAVIAWVLIAVGVAGLSSGLVAPADHPCPDPSTTQAMVREINSEDCAGDTPLTRMLDEAIIRAIESAEEGVEEVINHD